MVRPGAAAIGMALVASVHVLSGAAHAGEPSFAVTTWGVADGLVHERVNCIAQDRDGWMWFGTWEGISRFDGRAFENFTTADGLAVPFVNTITEDTHGRLWIGLSGGGVARFVRDPRAQSPQPFAAIHVGAAREADIVGVISIDADERMWCATELGLCRAKLVGDTPGAFETIRPGTHVNWAEGAPRDRRGHVWMSNDDELVELDGDSVHVRAVPRTAQSGHVVALALDGNGDPLVATETEVFVLEHASTDAPSWRELAIEPSLPHPLHALCTTRDGATWIGTEHGLVRVEGDGQSSAWLKDAAIRALVEDRDGNLWAGTWSNGISILTPSPVRSWTMADGVPDRTVARVVPAQDGRVVCSTEHALFEIVDGRVHVLEGSQDAAFGHVGMSLAQDARGDWWIGADGGMWHGTGPTLRMDALEKLADDLVPAPRVFGQVFDDRARDQFVFCAPDGGLYSVRAEGKTWIRGSFDPGSVRLPGAAREFLRDSTGVVWFVPYVGLSRWIDGRLEDVAVRCGRENVQPRTLVQDSRGRIWMGTRNDGLWRVEGGEFPRFTKVAGADVIGSEAIWSIAEDPRGRFWLATGHGVVRFDPDTNTALAFTSHNGVAGDIVLHCACDARGRVWAATSNGVSAVDSGAEVSTFAAPPTFIMRVRIGGVEEPLPRTGVVALQPIELGADRNDVEIAFASPAYGGASRVRWQHRLGGDAWSQPSDDTNVRFARLAPGDYRFEVRAVTARGTIGADAARFDLAILPPVWRRPWFIALCAVALAFVGVLVHRARLRRVLALERIRSQIAADLHDDLGAGLAQIAILSEVARRDVAAPAHPQLSEIAGLARSLRESVGEIVWAIDPRKDSTSELVRRVRQVAFNILDSENVVVEFHAPGDDAQDRITLAPDQRRHLLLAAKEALANVARHAQATRVTVEFASSGGRLSLRIQDDGCGFETRTPREGHGLSSLRRRAQALGAEFSIQSSPGQGTRVEISMPLGRPHVHAGAQRDAGD